MKFSIKDIVRNGGMEVWGYGGIRIILPLGTFLDLEVLGHFELYQAFICQSVLIFPNKSIIYKKTETF